MSAKLGLTEDPLGLSLVCDKRKMVRDLLQVRLMIEPWNPWRCHRWTGTCALFRGRKRSMPVIR
ncbi:MAG: hypothetical protein ACLR0U_12310 [Enterocloster clostridioformis]